MRPTAWLAILFCLAGAPSSWADQASPQGELKIFRDYFVRKFPKVPLNDFVNGPYSMNEDMRKQWIEKEDFPPYDFALDRGKELFETPFKNGKTFGDCFPNRGIGVRQDYPYFDEKTDEVVTLELAVNQCLHVNGEKLYSYVKDDMAAVTAYMAYTSRGKPFNIKTPDSPAALKAYQAGKQYFYERHGQLNLSCASCHVQNAGERIRAETLAPALGILNAMPIYRSDWGGMGTTSRRFVSCSSQVRVEPLDPQDPTYRNLEYYLSYLSNGLPISGPGARP